MLKFLGTGSAFNVQKGNTAAYMEYAGELFLFDVGEDVFRKCVILGLLEKKASVNMFITHLHCDHIGSLASMIGYLYYKIYAQQSGKICVYFPSEAIRDLLRLQGINDNMYTLYVNRWDNLYSTSLRNKPEYSFYDTSHDDALKYNGADNCYSIEFIIPGEGSFFYSGDTNVFHPNVINIHNYDVVYYEVTSNPHVPVHLSYEQLLEETKSFTKEQRGKIQLMHLDEAFDIERAKVDGFSIAESVFEKNEV